jgi:endoglucanase
LLYTGVNLSGAEWGTQHLPGVVNSDYTYPSTAEVDYFVSVGLNIFRLGFRWERLQPTINSQLDFDEFNRMLQFVFYATGKGAYVILDPHNFARYYPDVSSFSAMESGSVGVIGGSTPNTNGDLVTDAVFADFWSRVASSFKLNQRVIFNLCNEPNSLPTEQWVAAANAAIAAIRNAGAGNLILVPGNGFTGAWTWDQNWYGTPNSLAMLNIVDPANNFAFDVHQYLDNNGSGVADEPGEGSDGSRENGSTQIANNDPNIGVSRLTDFTNWLRANNLRGFLGEFGLAWSRIAPGDIGAATLTNMLDFLQNNADVWLGWTWWAGGLWWDGSVGNANYTPYQFLLDPDPATGNPRPQMAILQQYAVGP